MNPEILKKCLSGEASDTEWKLYEDWLRGEAEEIAEEIDLPASAASQMRMWQEIKKSNQKQDLFNRRKQWMMYTSAAAILIIISLLVVFPGKYFSETNYSMVFSHQTNTPFIEKEFDGLKLKLGTQSTVRLENLPDNKIDIAFSGNMILKNTTLQDKDTEVFYTEADGHMMSKKLLLRRGRTYLFAYYPFEDDKLMVIENRNLIDMPPVLALNLENEFN